MTKRRIGAFQGGGGRRRRKRKRRRGRRKSRRNLLRFRITCAKGRRRKINSDWRIRRGGGGG